MNLSLLKEIVSHVMANFGIIPSEFVNHKKTDSLLSPKYLLDERMYFESEGEQFTGKTWGCQISVAASEVRVMLGECTLNKEFPEFAMVIASKDAPVYGLYLCYNEMSIHPGDSEPHLAVSTNAGKDWMNCTTFIQATFLAAMEQVRDLKLPWVKVGEHKDLYQALLSFTNYHHAQHGD